MFIRAAAAGLVPKDSSTPRAIRTAVAPSSQWSMVHHHTPERRAVGAGEGVLAAERHRGHAAPLAARAARRVDGGAEGLAALLEVGELVEGGAGRRQQHDGVLAAGRAASAKAARDGRLDRRRSSAAGALPSSVAAKSAAASPIR